MNRQRVAAQWVRELPAGEQLGAVSKADILAAVVALDDWLDANVSTINAAIPQPARAQLTAAQKYALLGYILMRRSGKLWAEGD
ncbi:hypothetical protein [Planobispora siamensis]|uniref:hypothetical protein n=1 Tax=Planobispora siamensis TaxID=936338 RepID=UPI001951A4CB|nr:hypothetical protein [Planobispora siamensis]